MRDIFLGSKVLGYNVDRIDVEAGVNRARELGYTDPTLLMVVEFALMRWKRNEEEGAMGEFLHYGISATSAYDIIAAARAKGEENGNHC